MAVRFEGKNYSDRGDGYFMNQTKEGKKYLHREVWAAHYGEIPEGCVIHHMDHDPSNNDISNLELMTETQHLRYHANCPGGVADRARRWREENKQYGHKCVVCGKEFTSIFPPGPHALYCGMDCSQVQHRRRQRAKSGKDPIVEFTPGEKICKQCGKTYTTSHRRKSLYCSKQCRWKAKYSKRN